MAIDDPSRALPPGPLPPDPVSPTAPGVYVRPRKLYFGLAAAAIAWVSLGIIDIFIAWAACSHHENMYGGITNHWGARMLSLSLSLVLLATAATAGTISYRNWRSLSRQPRFLLALATEPHEFVAMLGVIISVTLGMGIVWLALAPIFITACQRAK